VNISPKSIENVGGYIFDYRVKNVNQNLSHHRLVLDVKDKKLREELGDVFEKCPSILGKDTLKIDFEAIDKSGGILSVNERFLQLLRFGDFYSSGDEKLPMIKKIVELTKKISQVSSPFQKDALFLGGNVQKYNLKPGGMIKLAEYEQEPDILKRFEQEVTVPQVYDFNNAKYVSGEIAKIIHLEVLRFFDVI